MPTTPKQIIERQNPCSRTIRSVCEIAAKRTLSVSEQNRGAHRSRSTRTSLPTNSSSRRTDVAVDHQRHEILEVRPCLPPEIRPGLGRIAAQRGNLGRAKVADLRGQLSTLPCG